MPGDQRKPSVLRKMTPEDEDRMKAKMALMIAERDAGIAMLPKIREEGAEALRRLLPVAQRDTGQSGVVARFLLGLYNGDRFPFDLTDLRRLDASLFEDCLAVLRMDHRAEKEVHLYFEDGSRIFEQLAIDWGCGNSEAVSD